MPKIVSENEKRAKRAAAEGRRRTLQVMSRFHVSAEEAAKVVADLERAQLLVRTVRLVRAIGAADADLLTLSSDLGKTEAHLRRFLRYAAAQQFMDQLEKEPS